MHTRDTAWLPDVAYEAVREIDLQVHADARGKLVALEKSAGILPFDPVRVFFIYGVPEGAGRANHAVDTQLFIMALSGQAMLTEFAADQEKQWRVRPERGLLVPALRYFELSAFEPGTILAVLAPRRFEETRYFTRDETMAEIARRSNV